MEPTVCIDTFEEDDIATCNAPPASTIPPHCPKDVLEGCTTGVVNDLCGCEPVGVTPIDLQPTTTEVVVAVGEPPVPPMLPATGTAEGGIAAVGSLLLFLGLGMALAARR